MLTVLSTLGGYLAVQRSNALSAETFGVTIPAESLALGEVWVEDELSCVLPFRNPTREYIRVTEVRGSCSCTSVAPESLELKPGETMDVTLSFDLRDLTKSPAEWQREFSTEILVTVSGVTERSKAWHIHGTLKQRYKFERSQVEFFRPVWTGHPPATQAVIVRSAVPLASLTATCDPSLATIRAIPVAGDVTSFELQIVLTVPRIGGAFDLPVTIQGQPASGDLLAPVTMHLKGQVVDDVIATPQTVTFGLVPVGELREESVVLRSRSGEPFDVSEINLAAPDAVMEESGANSENRRVFRIRKTALLLGDHAETIRFTVRVRGAEGDGFEVPVRVFYHGI